MIAKQADGSVAFAVDTEVWTGRLEDWERTRRCQRFGRRGMRAQLIAGDGAYIAGDFDGAPADFHVGARGETIGRFSGPQDFDLDHLSRMYIQSDRIVGWSSREEMWCYMIIDVTLENPAELPCEAL